jgi:beta-lactamase class A
MRRLKGAVGLSGIDRRVVLGALPGLWLVAGCGTKAVRREPPSSPAAPDLSRSFALLESRFGARLGVFARNTGTGRTIVYRQGERFALCSTYKTYAVAALLKARTLGGFGQVIPISTSDLVEGSPVTSTAVGSGMTISQLSAAAITKSDNTAANLLLKLLGGPQGVTAFARSIGDRITRLDRNEPSLNADAPGDPRDTTTPAALGTGYQALVLGDALAAPERSRLKSWLLATTTGTHRIRAGLPAGWTTGDKTGTGDHAALNDVAITWPGQGAPLVIAVLTDKPGSASAATGNEALLAQATALLVPALS